MSYTGGYQCRASLRCSHNICARSAYCNFLRFLWAPSLILILSIRRALFPESKVGKGSRNNVQYHDMLCSCLYVFYVHNDQDQFFLPRMGPSNLILDCVANRWFFIKNLSEYRTMHDWNWITLLHPCFGSQWLRGFFSYNFTILQFAYNFSLVVANSVYLFFVCLFHFVF